MKKTLIISALLILILFIYFIFKRIKESKKREEIRAKKEAQRQARLAALRLQIQHEDKELSIEKNVKCDDGITRTYNGSMYGVLIQIVDGISVDSIFSVGINDKDYPFSLYIPHHKWFSEDGITLKSDEIFLKYQEYNTLKTDYKNRYSEIMGSSKGSPRNQSNLICINNIFFHAGFVGRSPQKLFSGTINGEEYLNGVKRT